MRAINPIDYYHPKDREALRQLQQIPGFSAAMKAFMKLFQENLIQGLNMSGKVRLGPGQLPEIYRLLPPICETLGIREPELYLELNPVANAYTFGDTVISITTGIADLVGDLSAMFDERPAVEDCTTMPERRESKKHDYEQSM